MGVVHNKADIEKLKLDVYGDGSPGEGIVNQVSALDETVNGDGTPGSGIIGDIGIINSDINGLQGDLDAATEPIFTTVTSTESDTWAGLVRFEKIGKMVVAIVKITSGVPTDGTAKDYVTIPAGWEPALDIVVPSATNLGGMEGWLKASSAGKISTSKTNKTSVFGQIVWTIGATEEVTPTE